MLTEGLVYSQIPSNIHTKIKIEKNQDYYKQKCRALKQKLLKFEHENEKLIEENCYLLDKNYQYNDTITVLLINQQISKTYSNEKQTDKFKKKLETDYQSLIKHTKILTGDLKTMVNKVQKAESIILALKRTGHPSIGDLIDTLSEKQNTILSLEDQVSHQIQTLNFTQKENDRIQEECKRLSDNNKELSKLLGYTFNVNQFQDSLKVHHNNVNDDNQLLIKQLRSEIYELHSKNLLFEQNARNSQKLTQKAVEDHVQNQQELSTAQSLLDEKVQTNQILKEQFIQYQQKNPSIKAVEIKRMRRFVLQ